MSLVERVARAMEPDVWGTIDSDVWLGKERAVEASLERARAVIAAMREPTEAMTEAGRQHCRDDQSNYGDAQANAVYTAMIDAAVKERA